MVVSRIAPTPSGFLHAGNAFNFILTWLIVRANNGTLWLRIDDLDSDRTRKVYVEHIFHVLAWLGLDWDEGPRDAASFYASHALEHRLWRYEEVKKTLLAHPLVYACACSRKEILSSSKEGIYPLTCKEKLLAWVPQDMALRLHVKGDLSPEAAVLAQTMGDFILWRKEDLPSYHLASLVDDWHMETTVLVRGEDLVTSTLAQRYVAHVLGYSSFLQARCVHHPLLKTSEGQKLSKSQKAPPVELLSSPKELFAEVSRYLNLPPCYNAPTLLEAYQAEGKGMSLGGIFELGGEK